MALSSSKGRALFNKVQIIPMFLKAKTVVSFVCQNLSVGLPHRICSPNFSLTKGSQIVADPSSNKSRQAMRSFISLKQNAILGLVQYILTTIQGQGTDH